MRPYSNRNSELCVGLSFPRKKQSNSLVSLRFFEWWLFVLRLHHSDTVLGVRYGPTVPSKRCRVVQMLRSIQ